MTLSIASVLLAQIRAAADASPRLEVCGLLHGDDLQVIDAVPCRNVADDPSRRFEIDPAALLAAHRAARGGGTAVIGHYHSHPTGVARPSACDAASAAPDGALWLIVGAGEITCWRAVRDGAVHGRFDPVAIATPPACASPNLPPEGLPPVPRGLS